MNTKKMKPKKVKAWAVVCDNPISGMRAYSDKDKAIGHKSFLNLEYSGECKHKVVPCIISYVDVKRIK